jgi:hypothetical protein
METEREFSRKLKDIQCQLRRQRAAIEELGLVLERCASNVTRRDQAVLLDGLKADIMKKVGHIQLVETAAGNAFTKRKLTAGVISFAVDTLGAAIAGHKDPPFEGAKLLQSALEQDIPFGTVLVGIGKKGLPEDVTIVPVSKLARDTNRSEAAVRESLQNRGYLLLVPQVFVALVDSVKSRVLDGSLCLPLGADRIARELPSILYEPGTILRARQLRA